MVYFRSLRLWLPLAMMVSTLALIWSTRVVTAGSMHVTTHVPSPVVFTLGIAGGNMLGWSADIHADGTLTSTRLSTHDQQLQNPKDVINGLKKLANAENFLSMKTIQSCGSINPDVSSRFIIAALGTTRRQVRVSGTCNKPFNQLWATLYASAGVTTS